MILNIFLSSETLTMKRGRKTTISTEDIRQKLIFHKEQILQNNILIKSSNNIWEHLINKYNWNITSKALRTRIFKYSPNYDKFFESESKQCKTLSLILTSLSFSFSDSN